MTREKGPEITPEELLGAGKKELTRTLENFSESTLREKIKANLLPILDGLTRDEIDYLLAAIRDLDAFFLNLPGPVSPDIGESLRKGKARTAKLAEVIGSERATEFQKLLGQRE